MVIRRFTLMIYYTRSIYIRFKILLKIKKCLVFLNLNQLIKKFGSICDEKGSIPSLQVCTVTFNLAG